MCLIGILCCCLGKASHKNEIESWRIKTAKVRATPISKAWPVFAYQGPLGNGWLMRCGIEQSLTKELYHKSMGRLKETTRDSEAPKNSLQQGAITTAFRSLKK